MVVAALLRMGAIITKRVKEVLANRCVLNEIDGYSLKRPFHW